MHTDTTRVYSSVLGIAVQYRLYSLECHCGLPYWRRRRQRQAQPRGKVRKKYDADNSGAALYDPVGDAGREHRGALS